MNIIIDTCFWIALLDTKDNLANTKIAEEYNELLELSNKIIIPFPSMYEFLNSRFSRRGFTAEFKSKLAQEQFIFVMDDDYRSKAQENFFDGIVPGIKNDLSLVDEVIKEMIIDINLKIDCLISFDEGLNNFASSRGIEIIKK